VQWRGCAGEVGHDPELVELPADKGGQGRTRLQVKALGPEEVGQMVQERKQPGQAQRVPPFLRLGTGLGRVAGIGDLGGRASEIGF